MNHITTVIDQKTGVGDVDPIYERKQYLKKYLLNIMYDQLARIIIEYDYNFNGEIYKIIEIIDECIYSICTLSDNEIVICCLSNMLKIWNLDENKCKSI